MLERGGLVASTTYELDEKDRGRMSIDLNNLPTIDGAKPAGHAAPQPERPAAQDGKKPSRWIVILVVLAVLALIGGGIWWFASSQQDDFYDTNAILGQAPYKSPEEVQAELDRIVEEGMFNISIASVIEFDDGASPGTAYIENVPGNRYVMKVAITLDDTDETVYESKGIKPGNYLETIVLDKDLEEGNYAATATFSAFDAESLDEVGKAAAKVTLSIKG